MGGVVITFIKILLFGGSVILTPKPIDIIDECVDLVSADPISALNSGASLRIDVSPILDRGETRSIDELRARVKNKVPVNSVWATLYTSGEGKVEFRFDGHTSIGGGTTQIVLLSGDAMPIDQEFNKVSVCSKISLRRAKIIWQNYSM